MPRKCIWTLTFRMEFSINLINFNEKKEHQTFFSIKQEESTEYKKSKAQSRVLVEKSDTLLILASSHQTR